jgi:hypothetical protein
MSSSYRSRRLGNPVRLAVAAMFACAAGSASAANDWVFDPRVEVGAVYDDNYRLTDEPGQEIDVTGAAVDAALTMRADDQRTKFELTPHVHSTFFPDASSEEATDYFLSGLAQKRTQRLLSSFAARFADESVVSSELAAADFPGLDLGQTVSGDTGLVTVRNRRRLIVANPSLAYDWTERRHVTFDLQYVDADYQNRIVEQVGYKDYAASAGLVWDISQRHVFSLQLVGDRYDPADSLEPTNTGGVTAEWRTSASEVTSYYFRLGARHSERNSDGTTADLSDTNFNGGVGAAWRLQTTQVVLDFMRNTVPSSSGVVVNRDELRFRVARTFQPRFSAYVAARGIQTRALDETATINVRDRKYATASTGFEWRASRQFSLHGEYEYRWQEFEGSQHDARSNAATLSVVYEPRRLN